MSDVENPTSASDFPETFWLQADLKQLFVCQHTAAEEEDVKAVVLICNPLGMEYMSGYRSIRVMAQMLAQAGLPAFRFDYACTGNASGAGFEEVSVQGFIKDIELATTYARQASGTQNLILLGIGLGATFAALAAEQVGANALIMWNPTTSGRRFVREQKLLSELLNKDLGTPGEEVDAAGVCLSEAMQAELKEVDLLKIDFSTLGASLLVQRSDMAANEKLASKLEQEVAAPLAVSLPGYREMMDYPTETVVPVEAMEYITRWSTEFAANCTSDNAATSSDLLSAESTIRVSGQSDTAQIVESTKHFGQAGNLFGIACAPGASKPETAIVFMNCGSEHHAGPHRMYTRIARHLAQRGFMTFRFDLEGIGESSDLGNNPDNNPYPAIAISNVKEALHLLANDFDCRRFIVIGICAGAYHSFQSLAEIDEFDIAHAILVNPLVFEWDYDHPEDHFEYKVHTYRVAFRDPGKWVKLIAGGVDYKRLVSSLFEYISIKLKRRVSQVVHRSHPETAPGLPGQLSKVFSAQRKFSLILAENDPGLELLKLQGGSQADYGLDHDLIRVQYIANSNHGFSKQSMQDQLIRTVLSQAIFNQET